MNRPTPDPSQEGNRRRSASFLFPSWEGLGVGSWSQCMRKSERRLAMNLVAADLRPLKLKKSEPTHVGCYEPVAVHCPKPGSLFPSGLAINTPRMGIGIWRLD